MDAVLAPTVLISENQIREKVRDLGRQISEDYAGRSVVAVCVMVGALMFAADLLRCVNVAVAVDTMELQSYRGGTESSGRVELIKRPSCGIAGVDVLIIEDIVDTGRTLAFAREMLAAMGATDVRACALLSKPERREVAVEVEYVGFEIANQFVVGYGLDYRGMYRQLPYIGVVNT